GAARGTRRAGARRPGARARPGGSREGRGADRDGRRAGGGDRAAGGGGGATLRRRHGRSPGARMTPDRRYYAPDIQALPRERVRALQAERLARQLDRIWDTPIPFFRRKLESAGLRRDLRGLDDLHAIPTTVKSELRASEEQHPPFGDYRGAPPSAAVR